MPKSKNLAHKRVDGPVVVMSLNPLVTNGLSHPYHLNGSPHFRGIGSNFSFFSSFFGENQVRKQNSPRRDATFCDVTSGVILFAYVQYKVGRLIRVNL